uniref:Uncharacterized protein n=1 Tax=Rhizophora mucronata TaxID=61149 RepID=A0A2P2R098_RHIMU
MKWSSKRHYPIPNSSK